MVRLCVDCTITLKLLEGQGCGFLINGVDLTSERGQTRLCRASWKSHWASKGRVSLHVELGCCRMQYPPGTLPLCIWPISLWLKPAMWLRPPQDVLAFCQHALFLFARMQEVMCIGGSRGLRWGKCLHGSSLRSLGGGKGIHTESSCQAGLYNQQRIVAHFSTSQAPLRPFLFNAISWSGMGKAYTVDLLYPRVLHPQIQLPSNEKYFLKCWKVSKSNMWIYHMQSTTLNPHEWSNV